MRFLLISKTYEGVRVVGERYVSSGAVLCGSADIGCAECAGQGKLMNIYQ